MDQSFSTENLRKIFDYENRKGNCLEGDFFPDVKEITDKIRDCNKEIKEHKGTKNISGAEAWKEEKYKLKEKKEILLLKNLDEVRELITGKKFAIKLEKIDTGTDKKLYRYKKSDNYLENAASYFALKQIQNNLRKLYKVKQGSRHNIVCQLREILSNKLPKDIIKIDILNFYESIRKDFLFNKLNDNALLTHISKKIIGQTLYEYEQVSGNTKGLPRGIGISAYLSELYLRNFDEEILKCSNVMYYARYVDDIIIICKANRESSIEQKLDFVRTSLATLKLRLNEEKTDKIPYDKEEKLQTLDYLGYQFSFGKGKVGISLTQSKIEKYKNRIKLSFDDYHRASKSNKAGSLLKKRIRFLTGNTRLFNNKKNAVVGIYFSYNLITKTSCLNALDKCLGYHLNTIEDDKLKSNLESLSFSKGFKEKRFFKFSAKSLPKIVKVWKYVE